jgi:hypothetical protein
MRIGSGSVTDEGPRPALKTDQFIVPYVALHYQTGFEESFFRDWSTAYSFFFLLIGSGLGWEIFTGRLKYKGIANVPRWFKVVWCTGWGTATLFLVGTNVGRGITFDRALRDGNCSVIEGTVHVLHRQPYAGHDAGDQVEIGGQMFEVSDYQLTLAYNRTISHGGVLQEGVRTKVFYVGNAILRIQIAK